MTADRTLLLLLGSCLGILAVSTAVTYLLRFKLAGASHNALIENLTQRINAWWVMVLLLGTAMLIGKAAVIPLFALLSFQALREFITLTHTRRADHWALVATFFVATPIQYGLIWYDQYGIYAILIPVYGFLFLPILSALRADTKEFFERVAKVQWGLMICVYCISYVPALFMLKIANYEGRNALLIAFLVFVVQLSDVLQYVWGKLFGKHKIAPSLSPSKTWEGFVGGVLSASAVGAALWWMTPYEPWQAALIAFLITLLGFLGGLVMSAIKRDQGVKDWGDMISGHGGILDRLDSIIFSAPVFFHVTRYWWGM
ncbi:MAG TPA: phosphatidate cytidylyltransferase [Micropepsaceae bacterium]|nr:phosphatidate cytidylyltransferase [Micropepsaceae bacterium]